MNNIIESPLCGYWDWDYEEETIYLSPSFKKTLGYKEDDLDSKIETYFDLMHSDDLPANFNTIILKLTKDTLIIGNEAYYGPEKVKGHDDWYYVRFR